MGEMRKMEEVGEEGRRAEGEEGTLFLNDALLFYETLCTISWKSCQHLIYLCDTNVML